VKLWWPLAGITLLGLAAWAPPTKPKVAKWSVILGGDMDGYLSPCGCTSPMTGGLRRRATATQELSFGDRTVILDNGSLAGGTSTQEQMKAQTAAEALRAMGATAIHFTSADAPLGQGLALSMQALSGNRLVTDSVQGGSVTLKQLVEKGPFLVSAASTDPTALANFGGQTLSDDQVATDLVVKAQARQRAPILLLHGSHVDAVRLATAHPKLALIQYRTTGNPPPKAERVGNVLLATAGEHGKSIVRLIWGPKGFEAYAVVSLGPQFADDPKISRIYDNYLKRVDQANLLAEVPRRETVAFAGSKACAPCHQTATKVWQSSAHAHALATLETKHEDRDPECVPCHVTGLESTRGFMSKQETPQFAFVGCESCHGPALDHSKSPATNPLPKVGESACAPCHTSLNSPNFDFAKYWKRVQH